VLGQGLPTTLRPPTTPLSAPEWSALRDECTGNRLTGLLVDAVSTGVLPTDDGQRADAAALELELTTFRSLYDEVCRPPLAALEEAGIEHRLLKGSALPWSDFPDPQQRPTADLDVLVPGDQLMRAAQVTEALGGTLVNPEPAPGYARHVFKGLTVRLDSGLEVDLHRTLAWGPFGVRVPEADLWSPGRTFDRLGRPAKTLDVDRSLVHVAGHLLLLGAVRASEVRDVAQLACAPTLDADQVVAIARRWGYESVLATALRMAERELALAPGAHPLHEWAVRQRVPMRDRVWLRMERPTAPVRGLEQAAVFLELGDMRSRRIQLRAVLRPLPGTDPSVRARAARLRSSVGGCRPGFLKSVSKRPNR
jgi:hypothetical protein